MKYRIIADLYLQQAKIDLKAPGEFESDDYKELTPDLLTTLASTGAIEEIKLLPHKPLTLKEPRCYQD